MAGGGCIVLCCKDQGDESRLLSQASHAFTGAGWMMQAPVFFPLLVTAPASQLHLHCIFEQPHTVLLVCKTYLCVSALFVSAWSSACLRVDVFNSGKPDTRHQVFIMHLSSPNSSHQDGWLSKTHVSARQSVSLGRKLQQAVIKRKEGAKPGPFARIYVRKCSPSAADANK